MDVSRYLPLSQRTRDDESKVNSDERSSIAELIESAAALVAAEPNRAELSAVFAADAGLGSLGSTGDLAALASAVRAGKRRRAREVSNTTRALLSLADAVHREPTISPETLGRVSLYASTKASFDRRAALSGSTVRASDAGWEFGRGPVLEGTALGITRFLLGLSDAAPKPAPRQPPEVSAPISPDATI